MENKAQTLYPSKSSGRPSKIAIIGAGAVGTAVAYACAMRGDARSIVLQDINKAKVEAEALDMAHGIQVTPYVGLVPDYVEYKPNDAEIASVFSVPLEFFRSDPREVTHRIDYFGRSWYVPSYRFGEFKIWGLTAIMVVELVNLLYDDPIDLHTPPASFIKLS